MSNIVLARDGAIQRIEISRPDKKNAMTAAMYRDLANGLRAAARDPDVRAVIVHGAGGAFCAGNDLDDFLRNPPTGEASEVFDFLTAVSTFEKPLIAAVEGAAVGIGTTMLLHCDFVYVTEAAKFALPFVNLGITPEAGSSFLLPLMAGHQRAAELLLLGEPFSAAKALEVGIVTKIVPVEQLMETAMLTARKLADRPAGALRHTKRLMRKWHGDTVQKVIREEGDLFVSLLDSPEAKEAFSAFLEKRKPDFSKFR